MPSFEIITKIYNNSEINNHNNNNNNNNSSLNDADKPNKTLKSPDIRENTEILKPDNSINIKQPTTAKSSNYYKNNSEICSKTLQTHKKSQEELEDNEFNWLEFDVMKEFKYYFKEGNGTQIIKNIKIKKQRTKRKNIKNKGINIFM